MAHEIRRLSIDDFERIIKVWADAGLPTKPRGRDSRAKIEKEMANPSVAYFGLFDGEVMIGVGIANYDGRRGWVNRVAIDPDYRGRRLAGKIIKACEEFLYDAGAIIICALIEEVNAPSNACFSNTGYVVEPDIIYWTKRNSPDS
ncbi:MAG: GNAT family N-acetyltransferase [Candidatus Zixiibacteriota bacterium]|nr:MAG: GNAT family N-acetyltransferase [candidate division Zixibacteria bacterium]